MSSSIGSSAICSRDDFVAFVQRLSEEFRASPQSWEHKDIGSYLDALAAWVSDMDGYYIHRGQPVLQNPDWQTVADMLRAATLYE